MVASAKRPTDITVGRLRLRGRESRPSVSQSPPPQRCCQLTARASNSLPVRAYTPLLIANFTVDILIGFLDPRVKAGQMGGN